jgi:hypothetical protein
MHKEQRERERKARFERERMNNSYNCDEERTKRECEQNKRWIQQWKHEREERMKRERAEREHEEQMKLERAERERLERAERPKREREEREHNERRANTLIAFEHLTTQIDVLNHLRKRRTNLQSSSNHVRDIKRGLERSYREYKIPDSIERYNILPTMVLYKCGICGEFDTEFKTRCYRGHCSIDCYNCYNLVEKDGVQLREM